MAKIVCEVGETQVERILSHAINETTKLKVDALVFIGDAVEENPDILVTRARELGRLGVKVFVFQEGGGPQVERVFRDIATATGDAYARFDSGAAKKLGDLLKAVARYATGGVAALESKKDEASILLLGQMKKRN
jgi:hypothetical protein